MSANQPQGSPVVVPRNTVVQTPHNPYLLHYHEFQSLTKIHSFLAIWAHGFFAGTGVFFVTILARLTEIHFFNGTSSVSRLEWITVGILAVIVLVLELIYVLLPSEKKTAADTIQKHFDKYEK